MIKFLNKPYTNDQIHKVLDSDISKWFGDKYPDFTPPQKYSVKLVSENKSILISSPTGTGKTLSAFLGVINRLVKYSKAGKLENRVYAIYISPLRALGNDIEKNLETPLREIEEVIRKNGNKIDKIRHGVRTGDTTSYEKQKMNHKAPHILITTPESLAIMLAAPKFREKLMGVESVVIDEIHALAENKRGTHLSLSLERLEELCDKPFTRIGLSATVSPLEDVAKYLVGNERECKVVNVTYKRERDLKVIAPEKDPLNSSAAESHNALYKVIEGIVRDNRTTLIFTNTRAGTESVVMNLKNIFANEWNVDEEITAHHSSLSKEQRLNTEKELKAGRVRIVVSSTSLELGIDIGSIDAVIQVGSPKSIARCLQRVGRAGHRLGAITKGYFVTPNYDDLVEVAVMLKKSYEHRVDSIIIPKNALDVLAQHIMGLSLEKAAYKISDAFKIVKRAYPYRDLTEDDFMSVMDFLAGSEELAAVKVYGKIWLDLEEGTFGKRGRLARLIYMSNIGTIPDTTKIKVKVGKQEIGYVEEGFVENLRKGDIFVLGGLAYKFKSAIITTILVEPAPNQKPTIPRWFSEQLPLSFDLSGHIRAFRSEIFNMFRDKIEKKDILKRIKHMPVDSVSASLIYEYMKYQFDYINVLDKNISRPFTEDDWVIEYYNSKTEGFKIIFHTLYGRRVNDALSRIVAYIIGKKIKKNIGISVSDNGFMIHMHKKIFFDEEILKGIDVEATLREAIESTEILKRRFRHVATRGMMILKSYAGRTKTVGRQQMTSRILMNVVKKQDKFPLLEEAYREILEDYLDLKSLKGVLDKLNSREIKVEKIETTTPTPFAHDLVISAIGDIVVASSRKEFLKDLYMRIKNSIKGI